MNYIKNKVFTEWILKYLKKEDITSKTAEEVAEKILALDENLPIQETYIAPSHAILKAVITNQIRKYASHSAYKLICDAPPEFDLVAFAHAAMNLNTEEILKLIENSI